MTRTAPEMTGMEWAARVALVTGGSSGIGRAVALALAQCGVRVAIAARVPERLAGVVADAVAAGTSPDAICACPADVTREGDVDRMIRHTEERLGAIDILVACAGGGRPSGHGPIGRPVSQLSADEWDGVLAVNLRGTYLSNRGVLPGMIARRHGDIVNVASARGAVHGQAFAAAYCASKFAVLGMTEALAGEVASYGVRVQVLLPDVTRTPLLHTSTLAGRLGALLPPERVAALILQMIDLPADTVLTRPLIAPWAQESHPNQGSRP